MTGLRLLFTFVLSFFIYSGDRVRLSEANSEAATDVDKTITETMEALEKLLADIKRTHSEIKANLSKMVISMEKAAEQGKELSEEERSLLFIAYTNIVGARTKYWSIVNIIVHIEEQIGDNQKTKMDKIKDYRDLIKEELIRICSDVLDTIDKSLLPQAITDESKVFYYIMKGDYFRYLAEITTGNDRKVAAENARLAYNSASGVATTNLPSTHKLWLQLALSFSILYYDILNLPIRACRLAKAALADATAELDALSEESYKEATMIMQLIINNLNLWRCTEEDPQENEEEVQDRENADAP